MVQVKENRWNYVRWKICYAVLSALLFFGIGKMEAHAAEANVHFGSDSYAPAADSVFPLGVYLESTENIGAYTIRLTYDADLLEYQDGGTEGGGGNITISGDLQSTNGKFMLHFRALGTGQTALTVTEAAAYPVDGEEAFSIVSLPSAPIRIGVPPEPVRLTALKVNGVSVTDLDSENLTGSVTIPYAEEVRLEMPENYTAEASMEELVVGENTLELKLTDDAGQQAVYTLSVTMEAAPESGTPESGTAETEPEGHRDTPETEESTAPETELSETAINSIKNREQGGSAGQKTVIIVLVVVILAAVLIGMAFFYRKMMMPPQTDDDKIEENPEVQFASLYDD